MCHHAYQASENFQTFCGGLKGVSYQHFSHQSQDEARPAGLPSASEMRRADPGAALEDLG